MPGLSETTARVLIAEIGTDMSRFPIRRAISSRGPACAPDSMKAPGKRRSTRTVRAPRG